MKNYKLVNLLDADVSNFTTDKGIERRRKISNVLKKILKIATPEEIIVDRYPKLNNDEPYIFVSTHGFSNDIIACLASIDRSAYLLMGSTNQIEYNKLMYAAWLNGFIYVNRTDEKSRKDAIPKMERVLKRGSSVLIFPEGGHNNTENSLCNKLFASPYILSVKTGAKVVPIAPFYEFGSDKIYMNFGDPIDLSKYKDKTDNDSLMMKSQETMMLYKKYNINPVSSCLLAFVQLPLFFAFLEAINRVPAIFEGTFLGMNLGMTPTTGISQHNYIYLILIVLIILSTFLSFKNSMGNNQNQPPEMAQQMKYMLIFMIVMVSFASLSLPTAIALYWIVTNIFAVIQNIIIKKIIEKRI